jgi:hypothetical protein
MEDLRYGEYKRKRKARAEWLKRRWPHTVLARCQWPSLPSPPSPTSHIKYPLGIKQMHRFLLDNGRLL